MSALPSEERASLNDASLELAVWRGILKRCLGVTAFEAVERAVFAELKTQK
jgi:hypothetical protein